VLNYAQHRDTTKPVVQFRDERLAYRHETLQRKLKIEAIDDGSLRLLGKDGRVHVAMLEAKRTFQTIVDGAPTVSDRVLAQMVGEALALQFDYRHFVVSNNE
jgi:hypothetical protein